jgi:hypothetical protein
MYYSSNEFCIVSKSGNKGLQQIARLISYVDGKKAKSRQLIYRDPHYKDAKFCALLKQLEKFQQQCVLLDLFNDMLLSTGRIAGANAAQKLFELEVDVARVHCDFQSNIAAGHPFLKFSQSYTAAFEERKAELLKGRRGVPEDADGVTSALT